MVQARCRESELDGKEESVCIKLMKVKIQAILAVAALVAVSCVSTVNDRTTPGMPFVKDKIQGRYERSVDEIFQAAKDVIKENGVLVNESVIYNQTNMVKTVEGKVNQRNVWVRVQSVDPKITDVTVQTRTQGGGSDIDLAHELEKQIALKLK
jgi:maltose-binding protein MalE